MPWTPESFKEKHNKKLSKRGAKKAAAMANAILERTGDESLAIATANKHYGRSVAEKLYGGKGG